eukprot:746399-Hanusia_phi.AAC.2
MIDQDIARFQHFRSNDRPRYRSISENFRRSPIALLRRPGHIPTLPPPSSLLPPTSLLPPSCPPATLLPLPSTPPLSYFAPTTSLLPSSHVDVVLSCIPLLLHRPHKDSLDPSPPPSKQALSSPQTTKRHGDGLKRRQGASGQHLQGSQQGVDRSVKAGSNIRELTIALE